MENEEFGIIYTIDLDRGKDEFILSERIELLICENTV